MTDWLLAMQQMKAGALGLSPLPPICAPLETHLVAGPIVAYRAWQLTQNESSQLRLRSMVVKATWVPFSPIRGSPAQPYHGVYALKTLAALREYGKESVPEMYGAVALWGAVIEHELGYRAEWAYPLALWAPPSPMPGFPTNPLLVQVAEAYGVPLLPGPPEEHT